MNKSIFTPPANLQSDPGRTWLRKTGTAAGQLSAQRSNIELFCLLTCLSQANALASDAFTDVSEADAEWVADIEIWAKANPTLAKHSQSMPSYWKKYGFALYHNISSERYRFG